MSYHLGGDLPITEVSPGTNLLLSGPPMTGKYQLLLRLLGSGSDNVVMISTQHDAARIRQNLADIAEADSSVTAGVIDCVSQLQGRDVADSADTKYVATPKNLTRIGVAFTDFYSRWENQSTRVGFHSLSNLLMYSDLQSVYKFVQVLTGQIYNADWMSIVVFDPSMHDEQVAHTLQDPFDGVVETRDNDGRFELRIRGLRNSTTDWSRF